MPQVLGTSLSLTDSSSRGFHAAAPRDNGKERQAARLKQVPWGMVPKEVGAPARGIDGALGAKALTPRDTDLAPVLGPRLHPHGAAILAD